jgi:hypothetical protein
MVFEDQTGWRFSLSDAMITLLQVQFKYTNWFFIVYVECLILHVLLLIRQIKLNVSTMLAFKTASSD